MGWTALDEAEGKRRAQARYGKAAITEAKKVELYEALGLTSKEAKIAAAVEVAKTSNLAELEARQEKSEARRINENIRKLNTGELKPLTDAEVTRWAQVFNLTEAETKIFAESIRTRR